MPSLKPNHVSPTAEEDAAITAAALSDPDASPLSDEDFGTFYPYRESYLQARPTWSDRAKQVAVETISR